MKTFVYIAAAIAALVVAWAAAMGRAKAILRAENLDAAADVVQKHQWTLGKINLSNTKEKFTAKFKKKEAEKEVEKRADAVAAEVAATSA